MTFWGVSRCEDDLTHKLAEIIRHNNVLRKAEENGAPQHIIRQYTDVLQHDVVTYMDNTKPGVPVSQQRSGRAIKSISQRLKVRAFSIIILSCTGAQGRTLQLHNPSLICMVLIWSHASPLLVVLAVSRPDVSCMFLPSLSA